MHLRTASFGLELVFFFSLVDNFSFGLFCFLIRRFSCQFCYVVSLVLVVALCCARERKEKLVSAE